MTIKNIATLTALTTLMISGFAQESQEVAASDNSQSRYSRQSDYNNRNGDMRQSKDGSMTSQQSDDEMYGFRLSGEALFWKTTADVSASAYSTTSDPDTAPNTDTKLFTDFDWDWGYRIGANYQFCERNWGLDLRFLQFKADSDVTTTAPAGGQIVPSSIDGVLGSAISNGTASGNRVKQKFENKYTSLDGLLQREYTAGKDVKFYPGIGVKGVWLSQDVRNVFTGGQIVGTNQYVETDDQTFRGAGPKFALASTWMLDYGFSFYADFAASLLFGRTKDTYKQSLTYGSDYKVKLTSNFDRAIPVLETLFGIEWKYVFEDSAQALGLNLGFDGQYFVNQYVDNSFPSLTSTDSVGYYGISFGAFWEF